MPVQSPRGLPAEVLFAHPERSAVRLSPDGSKLAYLAPYGEAVNVWVGDATSAQPVTTVGGQGVHTYSWAPAGEAILYLCDSGGDEDWHLYAVELTTGVPRDLTPFAGVQAQLLTVDPRCPGTVVIGLNLDDGTRHDAYRLDLATGELTKAAVNEGFSRWIVDGGDLRVLGAVRPRDDGGAQLLWRDTDAQPWRVVLDADIDDALHLVFPDFPIVIDPGASAVHLLCSIDSPTVRLALLDLQTRQLTTVLADPERDIQSVTYHPLTGQPEVAYVHRDQLEAIPLTDDAGGDLVALHAAAGAASINVVGTDAAGRRWVVQAFSDVDPGTFLLYDRGCRRVEHTMASAPALDRDQLACKRAVRLRARDGLPLQAYLTFPREVVPEQLPTMVVVHGGPEGTDDWVFEPWPQLFAGRGYLVVQVNFRGSIGFGKAFLRAARKEWGRAMHHDVLDTIDWVVQEGYADPDRLGMFGTSYGGYETLTTVTREPGLLRCAVAGMAPVNLVSLLEGISPHWLSVRAQFAHRVGHLVDDRAMLLDRSPITRAGDIRTPLLLFYGERDPRVRVSEAEQLEAALQDNGVVHDLHILPGEGHFLSGAALSSRLHVADLVSDFVERYLPF